MKIQLIKSNKKGRTYQTTDFKILYRNKNSVSGDNQENIKEKIYLISGKAKVTIKDKTQTHKAPSVFEIPAKTHHKIIAATDIVLIIFDSNH